MEVFSKFVLFPRSRSVMFRDARSGDESLLTFCTLTVIFVGPYCVSSVVYIFDTFNGTLTYFCTMVVFEETVLGWYCSSPALAELPSLWFDEVLSDITD